MHLNRECCQSRSEACEAQQLERTLHRHRAPLHVGHLYQQATCQRQAAVWLAVLLAMIMQLMRLSASCREVRLGSLSALSTSILRPCTFVTCTLPPLCQRLAAVWLAVQLAVIMQLWAFASCRLFRMWSLTRSPPATCAPARCSPEPAGWLSLPSRRAGVHAAVTIAGCPQQANRGGEAPAHTPHAVCCKLKAVKPRKACHSQPASSTLSIPSGTGA